MYCNRHEGGHSFVTAGEGMNYFIAVIAGYRAAERRNRKAAVASTAAPAEMLRCVLTGWAVLLVLLQPVTACYSG